MEKKRFGLRLLDFIAMGLYLLSFSLKRPEFDRQVRKYWLMATRVCEL